MIPEPVIDEVRARVDIVEIVGEQVQLKRAGKDFKGLCPFHNEKTPSFYVVPAKGFYKCFGCGESGDVFTFVMKRHGLSFLEAAIELAKRAGIELPEPGGDAERDEPHRALYEALAFADDLFRQQLHDEAGGRGAREYVARRAITNEAVERFALGYAPREWTALRDAARRHGIPDEVLLDAGLIKVGEQTDEPYDRFRERLIFPIRDLAGRTIAFGGRTLPGAPPNAPKYLNSPETPVYHKGSILYGLNWSKNAIRREGVALLVEGYMDYVALAARGIENVVAGMGTALTDEQANLLARYAGRAVLLYDSDLAGLRASFRSGDALLRTGVHPLIATLPAGEDPDSLTRQGGAPALRRHVEAATDVLERKIQMLEERGFFGDIEGARRALDRLLPTIRATLDPALRDIYIARVAQRTSVRRATLEHEIEQASQDEAFGGRGGRYAERRGLERRAGSGRRHGTAMAWPEPRQAVQRQHHTSERLLLLILIRDARRIVDAATVVGPEDLREPSHRELYAALLASPDEAIDAAQLGPDARRLYESLMNDPQEVMDADQTFDRAVADIKWIPLFLKIERLQQRLAQAEGEEAAALAREKEAAHRQLRELRPDISTKMRRMARDPLDEAEPSTDES
jgi:DNA primase